MTTVSQMKCACPHCLCIVSLSDAIMVADKPYCSDACANGTCKDQGGCGHTGCGCG